MSDSSDDDDLPDLESVGSAEVSEFMWPRPPNAQISWAHLREYTYLTDLQ